MALPRKGSRTIDVGGERYRFAGFMDHYDGEDRADLIVEAADKPGQKIKARYSWTAISRAFHKVGKTVGKFDRVPPYVVRWTILYALAREWCPHEGGGVRDLGNLDKAIDFSELRPQSEDKYTY